MVYTFVKLAAQVMRDCFICLGFRILGCYSLVSTIHVLADIFKTICFCCRSYQIMISNLGQFSTKSTTYSTRRALIHIKSHFYNILDSTGTSVHLYDLPKPLGMGFLWADWSGWNLVTSDLLQNVLSQNLCYPESWLRNVTSLFESVWFCRRNTVWKTSSGQRQCTFTKTSGLFIRASDCLK